MSSKAKVLVVDDELSIREMLQIFLKREGFDVSVAHSGEAGLACIRKKDFNVVVSDIKMPDMTGIDLLRRVRSEGASGRVHSSDGLCHNGDSDSGTQDGGL